MAGAASRLKEVPASADNVQSALAPVPRYSVMRLFVKMGHLRNLLFSAIRVCFGFQISDFGFRSRTWHVPAAFFALVASSALAAEWLTDLPAAQATAKAENKVVLLDFTGSDWCGWGMRLRNQGFFKPE